MALQSELGRRTLTRTPLPSIDFASGHVEGLDECFLAHEGRFEAMVPFSVDGNADDARLAVEVGYQACSGVACFPAADPRFELPLSGLDLIRD
jgi:hypothetical protein